MDASSSHATTQRRAVSQAGAFSVPHPDAGRRRRHSERRPVVDEEPMLFIPSAVVVHESAQVTYASDLVHASPMEHPPQQTSDEEQPAETPQTDNDKIVKEDAMVFRRRHVYLALCLIVALIIGLSVGLTIMSSEARSGSSSQLQQGGKKRPPPPPKGGRGGGGNSTASTGCDRRLGQQRGGGGGNKDGDGDGGNC